MKKLQFLTAAILIGSLVSIVFSCKKNSTTPVYMLEPKQDVFSVEYNNHSVNLSSKMGKVSIDNAKAALGRLLFYDNRLSVNGKINCGSCHVQSKGFADGKAGSTGFLQATTSRNSMALINMDDPSSFIQSKLRYFWDGRAATLKELALKPIESHVEMGMDNIENIVKAVKNVPLYVNKFNQYFYSTGTDVVTVTNISACLAEFVRSLQGFESKFDKGTTTAGINSNNIQFVSLSNFDIEENYGKSLFYNKYNCISCHAFTCKLPHSDSNSGYASNKNALMMNIGLDGDADNNNGSTGLFKAPTLRNIALTAPYMHDGRFATLEDVIEHYSHGIKMNKDLAPEFIMQFSRAPKQFNITDYEKQSLIAFLKTLTDEEFLADKRYSNPYQP